MTNILRNLDTRDALRSGKDLPDQARGKDVIVEREDDGALQSEDATVQDWRVAEDARPDMIGETEDGLDETDESVRHAAEDRP